MGRVLGHDHAVLRSHELDEHVIPQASQVDALRHCDDVMASRTKALRDRAVVHLVEQEPHPASSACSRWCASRNRSFSALTRAA